MIRQPTKKEGGEVLNLTTYAARTIMASFGMTLIFLSISIQTGDKGYFAGSLFGLGIVILITASSKSRR